MHQLDGLKSWNDKDIKINYGENKKYKIINECIILETTKWRNQFSMKW